MSKFQKGHKGYWLGKKRDEETCLKISKENKGKVSPMKGKHHSESAKNKLRKKLKDFWENLPAKEKEKRTKHLRSLESRKNNQGCKGKHWIIVGKIKKKCLMCGQEFKVWPSQENKKYCSVKCKNAGLRKPKRIKKCVYCGGELDYYPYQIRNKGGKFCSRKCSYSFRVGRNNPNWKGGESRKQHCGKQYNEWTKKIFEYDNYTCQICEEKGGELNAHHLKSWKKYPKLRFVLSNGITLHKECHKLYGYHNNNL